MLWSCETRWCCSSRAPMSPWTSTVSSSSRRAALATGDPDKAEQALLCWGGELLPADRYEGWAEAAREQLRIRHLEMLRLTRRWSDVIELDPADESAHVALMRQYAEAGDRHAALRQFERLDRALRRELGSSRAPRRRGCAIASSRPGRLRRRRHPSSDVSESSPRSTSCCRASPEGVAERCSSPGHPASGSRPCWHTLAARRPIAVGVSATARHPPSKRRGPTRR